MADDREREIADLKRRLGDLERPTAASSLAPRPKSGLAAVPWYVWVLAGLGGLWAISSMSAPKDAATAQAVAEAPPVDDGTCEQAGSEILFAAMKQQGLIRGQEVSADVGGLLIVVDSAQWNGMQVASQQRLIAAADCGVVGPGKHLSKIVVRGSRSGSDLDVYDSGDLLKLRQQGLAKFSRTAP